MQRIADLIDYLITPKARLKEAQQREARILLSILLAFSGIGIVVAIVGLALVDRHERISAATGAVWTLLLVSVPYFIAWRTRFQTLALLSSLIAFDLAVFSTTTIEPDPVFVENLSILSFLLLPVILSSIFLRVRHTLAVSIIQVLLLYLYYQALPEGRQAELMRSVPLTFFALTIGLLNFAAAYRVNLEKGRQQELAESARLYRTLLESTFESVLVVQNGRVVDANASMEQLSGYTWQALADREARTLFAIPDAPTAEQMDTVLLHADGTPIAAEVVSHPLAFDDEVAIAYAFRNISERKRAETALQEAKVLLEEKVKERTAELEALNRGLQTEIARRVRVEDELRRSREDLRALYVSEQSARRISDALRDASLSLTQSLALPIVLDTLLDLLARLIPYDSADVLLVDSDNRLIFGALSGYDHWEGSEGLLGFEYRLEDFPIMEEIVTERKSVLVADTAVEPRWVVTEPGAHVRSWLGVPLFATGRVLGLYSLDRKEPNSFTEEHIQLAESLASPAAMAIENARLFEEVDEKRERLRRMAREEVTAVEVERSRISHALHDETGQALMVLQFSLRAVRDSISLDGRPKQDPAVIVRQLDRAIELAAQTMSQLRSIAHILRPAALDDLGLNLALESFCEEYGQVTGLAVRYRGMEMGDMPESVATSLYRLVQAALTNVVRHAAASVVEITLSRSAATVSLTIRDNGSGFDVSSVQRSQTGIGLIGMRERVLSLGGEIEIESAPGTGSLISATINLADLG